MIVNTFIREIIVYEDKIVITYNFTDQTPINYNLFDDLKEIEKQPEQMAFIKRDYSSYINTNFLPENRYTHPIRNNRGCVFFFLQDCFGISLKYDILRKRS